MSGNSFSSKCVYQLEMLVMNKLRQITKKNIGPFSENVFWIKSQDHNSLAVSHITVLLYGEYLTLYFHAR